MQTQAHHVVGDLAVEHPCPRLGDRHHLGEQVLQFQDLDTVVFHLRDEIEVVAAGLLQPDHVVEEQLVAVLRGEALVGESRCADQNAAQRPGLRPHSQPRFAAHSTARCPVASSATARTDVAATTATTTSSARVKTVSLLSLRAHT